MNKPVSLGREDELVTHLRENKGDKKEKKRQSGTEVIDQHEVRTILWNESPEINSWVEKL